MVAIANLSKPKFTLFSEPLSLEFHHVGEEIATVLQSLYEQQAQDALTLPSIAELAMQLECTELDMIDALEILRCQGYVYRIHGADEKLTLRRQVEPATQWSYWVFQKSMSA